MTRLAKTLAAALLVVTTSVGALEIDPNVIPEINFAGSAVVSAEAARAERTIGGEDNDSRINVADSGLVFGFSKYLHDSTRYGFGVIGFKLPNDAAELNDDIYIHEAHAGVGGKRWEIKLGRSRLGDTLIPFPTIRDDDLLGYTHVPNGSAQAQAEEYQQFGGVVEARWFMSMLELAGGLTARTETDATSSRVSTSDFNGGFLGIAYDVPEAIKFDRGVRYAGIRFDHQRVTDLGAGLPQDRRNAVIAALATNLSNHPEATWSADVQAIVTRGAEVADLATIAARARAKSRTVVAALRYSHRPALQTRWQTAVTLGSQEYPNFDGARSFVLVPSYGYRLGSGVEFLAQYIHTRYDGALAQALGHDRAQRFMLGLRFAFDHTFNESVGERTSILNTQHGMFDLGPMGGGH